MDQNTHTPLNGSERVRVIFFIIFSIVSSIFLVGIIPLVIIWISIYIMRKDQNFDPVNKSKKHIELYYKTISFVVVMASPLIIYNEEFKRYSAPSKYTENYYVKQSIYNNKEVFNEYFEIISKGVSTSESMLSIVTKADSTYTEYEVHIELPNSKPVEIEKNNYYRYGKVWGEKDLGIFTDITSDLGKYNQAINDYNDAYYTSFRDRLIYAILALIASWKIRLLPFKLIMFVYSSLYFNQVIPHAEWIVKNNIFSDRLKNKLKKITSGRSCSLADELEKLKDLLDDGAIDNDEFIAAKKKILGK
jgi:hypothetical protein